MTLRDPQTEWSALIFEALAQAGVREVVISPGSRSTPFVLAATHTPGLRCWDVVDERSAAFFALGQAKATGRPSLALCTSGSAGAHYLPAMVEANASHTPLLLFTADRPLGLQGCAAPQTIDQVKLFGAQARAFFELGLPDADPTAVRAVSRIAAQATLAAQWPVPGAVHLNARARKPLEPHAPANEVERDTASRFKAAARRAPATFVPRASPSELGVTALAEALGRARAPLFVAGPAPLSQGASAVAVAELVRRSRGVLLAEAASQLRFADMAKAASSHAFDAYLDLPAFSRRAVPDLIVQLGAAPSSSAYASFLGLHAGVEHWVLVTHGWNDPESRADRLLFGDLAEVAVAVGGRLPVAEDARTNWQGLWVDADSAAQRALAGYAENAGALVEGSVIREVVRSLPEGARLAIGNSLPLRELDLFCEGPLARCGVLSQRGANGIDGLISGAAGAASTGASVTLVLGDVSFLHDLGGLWAAGQVGSALTIVVLQNRGGRIFEDLPLAAAGVGDSLAHFTTPHVADLGAAAAIYGLRYARVSTFAELRTVLGEANKGDRCQIVEAIVPERGLSGVRREVAAQLSGLIA